MREPITSPTGVKYEWNDEKKNYFNEKQEQLPEEGFLHEGVRYTYDIKANNWLADGKALQVGWKFVNFSKISRFLERILMEHVDRNCNQESPLQLWSLCSVELVSSLSVIDQILRLTLYKMNYRNAQAK